MVCVINWNQWFQLNCLVCWLNYLCFKNITNIKKKINRINGLSKIDEEYVIVNEDDNLLFFVSVYKTKKWGSDCDDENYDI